MRTAIALATLLVAAPALTAQQRPDPGPAILSAGAVFEVESPDFATALDLDYKVAFEISTPAASPDQLNVSLNSVARFINMHVQAGVPREQVRAAIVVHGAAGWEMLDDEAYREEFGTSNPNATLIRELNAFGAKVILCGQTAASRGIPRDGLIDGVQVALSAMTAFVLLQEDGYRTNPW